MAFIKFSNYGQLNDAEVNASAKLAEFTAECPEGSYKTKNTQADFDRLKGLRELYDMGRKGAIYIDRDDANAIHRYT